MIYKHILFSQFETCCKHEQAVICYKWTALELQNSIKYNALHTETNTLTVFYVKASYKTFSMMNMYNHLKIIII